MTQYAGHFPLAFSLSIVSSCFPLYSVCFLCLLHLHKYGCIFLVFHEQTNYLSLFTTYVLHLQMNLFTCTCLWLLVKLMWTPWTVLVKHIRLVPIISDTFTFLEVTIQELPILWYAGLLFLQVFSHKETFYLQHLLKDEMVFKASLGFYTVCLGSMLLLTHVAVFTNCSWWCGWAYSDLHYIYILVLLNRSSLKSSPAG